jgi:hypothetical protein
MTFLQGENIWILEAYLMNKKISSQDMRRAQNLIKQMGKVDQGHGANDVFEEVKENAI